MKTVAMMQKAIHAQESKEAAREKAAQAAEKLQEICARLRHVAGTQWGTKRYMDMEHLTKPEEDLLSDIIAG